MPLWLSADFFEIIFFKKFFQEHSVSNCLDPDQDSSANDKTLLARKELSEINSPRGKISMRKVYVN